MVGSWFVRRIPTLHPNGTLSRPALDLATGVIMTDGNLVDPNKPLTWYCLFSIPERLPFTVLPEIMSEKEDRKKLITEEFKKIIEDTTDYCWEVLEEEFEKESIEALRKAADKLAYRRKYYDVMKDDVIFFPTVARLIMTNTLQEEAEKEYYEEEDEFPPEYAKALKTVCRDKGYAGNPDEENAENDAYMDKLAQDVEV